MPFDPPPGNSIPAVALGIMRQESSFDIGAVSPSGARGLMQLMPPTAEAVARGLGISTSVAALFSLLMDVSDYGRTRQPRPTTLPLASSGAIVNSACPWAKVPR